MPLPLMLLNAAPLTTERHVPVDMLALCNPLQCLEVYISVGISAFTCMLTANQCMIMSMMMIRHAANADQNSLAPGMGGQLGVQIYQVTHAPTLLQHRTTA